ncbi:MAG: branched-chain amino acid ABC transporter permease [Rhodospirillales bacterium]|nr:branched-chain amino acid ABC transporter permease [Rhodospirillales bacterium]
MASSDAQSAALVAAAPAYRPVIETGPRVLAKFVAGMAVVLLPLPLALGDSYWLDILIFTYLMAGLAGAWNIIGGFGGQFSLGHGVFFGVGAYVAAILYTDAGVSPWLGLLGGTALGAAVALLISWPTFRLRGPFFAIATMAFNQVAFVLVNYLNWPTNGPRGILIPFHAGFANMIFVQRWRYGMLMFTYLVLVTGTALLLQRSRLGYALLALREDEDAARAAGIDVLGAKLKGMAISAALTAIGGALFAMYLRFIDPPTVFSLPDVGVRFALLALIGGIGTLIGPILGAALIVPIENALRANITASWPGADLVILGAVMVLAARFFRRGVAGAVTDLLGAIGRRPQ